MELDEKTLTALVAVLVGAFSAVMPTIVKHSLELRTDRVKRERDRDNKERERRRLEHEAKLARRAELREALREREVLADLIPQWDRETVVDSGAHGIARLRLRELREKDEEEELARLERELGPSPEAE